MLKIEYNELTGGLWCLVKKNNEYFVVDLSFTIDRGPEAMVFRADENGKVTSWSEVFVQWYNRVSRENLMNTVREFLAQP